MIAITKDEAMALREQNPRVTIVKTCKLKNQGARRGKRWVEPTNEVIKKLKELRNTDFIE